MSLAIWKISSLDNGLPKISFAINIPVTIQEALLPNPLDVGISCFNCFKVM